MLSDLLSLAVPLRCAGCAAPDVGLCGRCAAAFRGSALSLPGPGSGAFRGSALSLPGPGSGALPLWSVTRYEGEAREAVVAWKDRGRHDLEPVLADSLAASVRACLSEIIGDPAQPGDGRPLRVVLVPVPSSRAAVRRRGEDVTHLLARSAAKVLTTVGGPPAGGSSGFSTPWREAAGVPGPAGPRPLTARAARLLGQRRGVLDQAGLDLAQRWMNTASGTRIRWSAGRAWLRCGRRGLREVVRGATVLLVDDIVTTGASLAAARAALHSAGITVAGAATVAWTPLHRAGTSGSDSPSLRTVGTRQAGLAWRARPDERGEVPRL